MQKKKIVYIAQSAGGVAEYLFMFLKNFHNETYENILIVSEDYADQLERFKPYTTDIHIVPMIREIKLKNDLKAILQVRKIIKKVKPDIVYLHSSKAGAVGRIALLFDFKTKILYNAHGWYFNAKISNKKKKIYAVIEKILALKSNKIINISKAEYDSALQYKITPEKKMCLIENAIDFSKFENSQSYREETREQYTIRDDEIVIGVVGRLSEQKDPMTSLKAFEILCKQRQDLKMMYVGAGELEETVKNYAKEKKIEDKIMITGWVNNVEKYIPAFDIAILPSKWEGFGLVLIEYMACDKPVVASNVGGIINIITNGKNGLLFPTGDYEKLAEKIEILINNKELLENIIEENKRDRDKYDIKHLIERHEKLFQELITIEE